MANTGCYTLVLIGLCLVLGGVVNGAPSKPSNLRVTKETPSAVHGIITMLKWDMTNSQRYHYYVRYNLNTNKNQVTQKKVMSTSARIYLKPNSMYKVKVMAFDASDSTVQGDWSDELAVPTGQSVPSQAPINVTATASTTTSILVRWGPIPQASHNGKLLGYIVFYAKRDSRRWKSKELKSSLVFQEHLSGLSPDIDYRIAVAGYTAVGVGKKSDAVEINRKKTATTSSTIVTMSARNPDNKLTKHDETTAFPHTQVTTKPDTTTPSTSTTQQPTSARTTRLPTSARTTQLPTSARTTRTRISNAKTTDTVVTTINQGNIVSTTKSAEITESSKPVENYIAKPTSGKKFPAKDVTSSEPRDEKDTKTTVVSSKAPNAQANIQESGESTGFVLKFIVPAAIGGLAMVLLVICLLWRRRRRNLKRNHGDEAIHLAPLGDNTKKKDKFVVTRGEGSIRYAPPPKTYNSSAPPPPGETPDSANQTDEVRSETTVVSEVESTEPQQTNVKRPYAEISIEPTKDKDVRYVKRNDHKPVPASPSKSDSSDSGYENMQHLYESVNRIKENLKANPVYMNVGSEAPHREEEGLYEEIPAEREGDGLAVQQPLLQKEAIDEMTPIYV